MSSTDSRHARVAAGIISGFRPADHRRLDEWARENVLVGAWSPWPGPFDPGITPWIIEPMRIAGAPGPKRITITGPAAGGKSTIGEVLLAWIIDNAPGLTVWFAQTDEAAKEFAETRINRVLESCPRVVRWFPQNRHKHRTQATHFPHMSLLIQSANETNAQSKHIRHLICDETWQYDPGMLAQLHKRTTRFAHNRTILELSTGSVEGDETDSAWHQGTRQEWQLKCPACGLHHVPRWTFGKIDAPGGVKWDAGAREADGTWNFRKVVESTSYECPLCRVRHAANAANGYALNRDGSFTEPAADAMPRHWSFHWNCIASDFSQLGAIAVEFLQAKAAIKRGTTALFQEFTQKKLAESWNEDRLPQEAIAQIDSDYSLGDPWAEEGMRVMIVDCQQTHFWALVRAFTKDGRSRLVDCARLESWESVRAFQTSHAISDDLVLVDSGKWPDTVYTECCLYGWLAIKGEAVPGGYLVRDIAGNGQRVIARASEGICYPARLAAGSKKGGTRLYLVSDQLSSEILARARAGRLAGWTIAKDAPVFYRAQLASMVRVSARNKLTGQPTLTWKELGNAGNHLWDCERYAIAAAYLCGYFHFTDTAKA